MKRYLTVGAAVHSTERLCQRGRMKGYFTVEAALVVNIFTWILVALLYLMFFVYDRAITDMNTAIVSLRVQNLWGDEAAVVKGFTEAVKDVDRDEYIAWDSKGYTLSFEKTGVRVTSGGRLIYPFDTSVINIGNHSYTSTCKRRTIRNGAVVRFIKNRISKSGGE
ncbi:MAG: hypothetical protein K6F84_00905 [Lachnospiraceae bacterium]|nr:hypothetical protein [Lachnospiraceae bacterium]